MNLYTEKLGPLRRAVVYTGIGLLLLAIALFCSTLLGVMSLDTFALGGSSGIRTLAGIAVAGCLAAAVGYFDE